MSPPPSSPPPPKSKGSKRRAPPPTKKQNKPRQKKPPPKLPYEKTIEELDVSVREELDCQIFKGKPPVEKKTDMVKFHRFIQKMEEEKKNSSTKTSID